MYYMLKISYLHVYKLNSILFQKEAAIFFSKKVFAPPSISKVLSLPMLIATYSTTAKLLLYPTAY